jgi:hypothetical protein
LTLPGIIGQEKGAFQEIETGDGREMMEFKQAVKKVPRDF